MGKVSSDPRKTPRIPKSPIKRRFLVVTYDVKGLTADEIDSLATEAVVQAESSTGHPCVSVCYEFVDSRG